MFIIGFLVCAIVAAIIWAIQETLETRLQMRLSAEANLQSNINAVEGRVNKLEMRLEEIKDSEDVIHQEFASMDKDICALRKSVKDNQELMEEYIRYGRESNA